MSACISRHGEYSEHTPDAEWFCTLCGDVDIAGLRAEMRRLRAGIEALSEDLHVLAHTTRCTGAMCDGCQAGRIEYRARTLLNPTGGETDE